MKDTGPSDPQRTSPIPEDLARQGGGERFGRFHLNERLGAGVSHDTWRAWEDAAWRWVAIRVWPRPTPADRTAVSAAVAWSKRGSLPEFPVAFAAGLEAGKLWIARPYIEGKTLRELTDADTPRLVRIARDAARALATLHAGGRFHGHLTGGNLLATPGGGIAITDGGLFDGDAAADVRSLAGDLCDVFGLPGAPGDPATAKGRLMTKGETTKVEEAGPLVLADERLTAILTRARTGSTEATALADELEGWLGLSERPPSRRPVALVVGGIALAAVLVGGGVLVKRSLKRSRFHSEWTAGVAAETEGRLDEALQAFRAAEVTDPSATGVHDAVARLVQLVAGRDDRRAEDARRQKRLAEIRPQLDATRAALVAATAAASSPEATRASIDRALEPAFAALRNVLEIEPQLPEAIDLAWSISDLGDQGVGSAGTFGRLPGNFAASTPSPVPAWREAFRTWYLFLSGPRAGARALRDTSAEMKRLGLARGWMPGASAPVDPDAMIRPMLAPLEALERSYAPGAPELRYTSAMRLFLKADLAGASAAFQDAMRKGAGEFSAEVDLMLAILEPSHAVEHATRGLARRPWELALKYALARAWFLKDVRASRENLDRALALHPGCIDLRIQRASLRLRAGELAEAFSDVDALASRDATALAVRGVIRFARRDFAAAEADLAEAIRRQPENVYARLSLVGIRLERGQVEGLASQCDAAIAADPEQPESFVLRSQFRISYGKLDEAISDADAALRLDPLTPDALRTRALARAWLGNDPGAMQDAEAAVVAGDNLAASLTTRALVAFHARRNDAGRVDARAAVTAGGSDILTTLAIAWGMFTIDEDLKGAEALCDNALEAMPGHLEALVLRAHVRFYGHDAAATLADLDAVLAVRPGDLPMRIMRIHTLADVGNQGEAIREADRLVEEYPKLAVAWLARASARRSSDGRSAVEDLDQALKVDPECSTAVVERAEAYSSVGRNAEAVSLLDAFLATPRGDAAAYRLRGQCREVKADYAGAVEDYTEAMRLRPSMRRVFLLQRASANLKAARASAAVDDAGEILRSTPNAGRAWWIMGEARRLLGQKDLAADAYRKVLEYCEPGDALRTLAEKGLRDLR